MAIIDIGFASDAGSGDGTAMDSGLVSSDVVDDNPVHNDEPRCCGPIAPSQPSHIELRKGPNDIVRAEPCQFLRFLFEHETCRAGMACKNNACVLTCFAVAARFPLRERNRVYSSIPFPWLPGPPGAKPQRFCRDSALDLSGVTIQQYITSAVSRVAASSHSDG